MWTHRVHPAPLRMSVRLPTSARRLITALTCQLTRVTAPRKDEAAHWSLLRPMRLSCKRMEHIAESAISCAEALDPI